MSTYTDSIAVQKLIGHIHKSSSRPESYEEIYEIIVSFTILDVSNLMATLNKDYELLGKFIFTLNVLYSEIEGIDEFFNDLLEKCRDDTTEKVVENWVLNSLDDADNHIEQYAPNREISYGLVIALNGPVEDSSITVSIVQEHPSPVGSILWDQETFKSRNAAFDAISLTGYGIPVVYDERSAIKAWKPKPMYQYFPERYRQSRTYVDMVPTLCKEYNLPGRGQMNEDKIQAICGLIQKDLNQTNARIPLKIRHGQSMADISDAIGNELSSYILYDAFVANGRKIFDINPSLVEMFYNTDVDGIPVNSLISPFETYYLYFGKQRNIKYKSGWYFDGAYVSHFPESNHLSITFTFCPSDIHDASKWTSHLEPRISITFGEAHYGMNLEEAVKKVGQEYLAELELKIREGDQDITDDLAEVTEGLSFEGMKVLRNSASNSEVRVNRFEHEENILSEALNLVVNTMCYLSSYADDIELDWVIGTPQSMIQKARKGHPTVKKNTEAKLNSMGYRRVYICGRSLNTGPATDDLEPSNKNKYRTHWRRGHWRNQAFGTNLSERRQILIKPVIVNPNVSPDDIEGSIYIDKKIVDLKKVKKLLNITNRNY